MARKTAIQVMGYGTVILVLVGMLFLVVIQRQTISQLREQIEAFNKQQNETARLPAENSEAQRLQNQNTELERLRADTKDLLRLRNEVRQLHERLQELEQLRAANAQLLQAAQGTPGVSSNQAARVMAVRKQGSILGINIRAVSDPQTGAAAPGAWVMGIDTNSPVATSGLQVGDIVFRLDGRPIENPGQLQTEMLTRKPGEIVTLDVVRGETVLRFQVKTRTWPE